MSLSLIFPGQGSQHVGMAARLAAVEPVAADTLRVADEVLGFRVSALMAEGPDEELMLTKNAQPALLAHSVAVLRVIRERLGPVGFAAGHSLGEFSAYVAAGTVSFEDALEIVRLRGELMYATGRERPGTMAAVLGLEDEVVREVCTAVDSGVCVPANYNSAGQVVISGDRAAVEEALPLAKERGARKCIELNVSGAFHSPLMAPAATGLSEKLDTVSFCDPEFPVVANATAEAVTDATRARELLVTQLTSAVRWRESVDAMVSGGASSVLELGPGRVLCGLNRRIARSVSCAAIGEPEQMSMLEKAS